MRELSFERSRQDENDAKLNINICKSNVKISRIKRAKFNLFFCKFFRKLISKPYYWDQNIVLYIKICRKLFC